MYAIRSYYESMVQHISSLIKQTNSELYNFTQSMGFATVVNGKTVFKPIAKVYQDTLDFAQMQVSSGAVDYIVITSYSIHYTKLYDLPF